MGRTEQLKSHNNLSEKLQSIGVITDIGENKDKFFHQLKFHGTRIEAEELWDEGKCFLQTYNVFWDTTDMNSTINLIAIHVTQLQFFKKIILKMMLKENLIQENGEQLQMIR